MSLGRPAMRVAEERVVRRNLEAHAARMRELISGGMERNAASAQALKDILTTHKSPKGEYRNCSCNECGWKGSRTLKGLRKPCPKCKANRVFPDNPKVMEEL
jgi:predicted Zn-ribbon and HTH transcriptional regulator